MIRLSSAVIGALLLATDPGAGMPSRDAAASDRSCPAGTQRAGAAPPEGFETWCEKPDELPLTRRHGPARAWYDDGGLARASTFVRGRLDGEFWEWHRNGNPARAGSYRDGEREGTWTLWRESGSREELCDYLHGARHGRFATWWPNGQRRAEGRYCHDLQCGTWTTWDEEGRELGKIQYEEIRGTP